MHRSVQHKVKGDTKALIYFWHKALMQLVAYPNSLVEIKQRNCLQNRERLDCAEGVLGMTTPMLNLVERERVFGEKQAS